MTIAALFTRKDSPYLSLGCDCYDIDRDALTWRGGSRLIAHPPCRAWGQYSHIAKPRPGERQLALWAIDKVRTFGGALEHPINSKLWAESGCSGWGLRDQFGGILVPFLQCSFGHRAPKASCLYLVDCEVPSFPEPRPTSTTVERMCRAEREATPPELAKWLVDLVGQGGAL